MSKVTIERSQFVLAKVEINSTIEVDKAEFEDMIKEYGSEEEALDRIFEAESTTTTTEDYTVYEIMEDLDTDDMRVI